MNSELRDPYNITLLFLRIMKSLRQLVAIMATAATLCAQNAYVSALHVSHLERGEIYGRNLITASIDDGDDGIYEWSR